MAADASERVESGPGAKGVDGSDSEGPVLGPYRLREKLGEGGCGVVYAAEQEEPLRRRVALKVLKLGMDTRSVVARFEAERHALALMEHPNIARVLDAGATPKGRPFFVMELVPGTRITHFCDQRRLPIRARVELFVEVCLAVQHAHQKGVIHRDLKPSNILVLPSDDPASVANACPKVIDFGIAKAVEQPWTEETRVTEGNQFLGTPAYISPEQAELGARDVDTRSDLYSLGVVLYELLTGRTPFDPSGLARAGLEGLRRTLREQDPPRPSARWDEASGFDLDEAAAARGTDVRGLRSALRGDLDWIVMKCLEKDRSRRYATANALAQDLRRYLRDEPVTAGAPGMGYRFRKFARRNRLAIAAATLMTTILVMATVVSVGMAYRAKRAEAIATHRSTDSEAIARFLVEVFQSPEPDRDGRTVTVAESLARAGHKLETDLIDQPERRTLLETTVADTYQALGLYPEAISLREKVRDAQFAQFGPRDARTLEAMRLLADSYDLAGADDQALALREESLSLRRTVFGPEHAETLAAMSSLADTYRRTGRLLDSLRLREHVVEARREILGREHPDTLEAMRLWAESPALPPAERLEIWDQLLQLCRRVHGPAHRRTLEVLSRYAHVCERARHLPRACALYEELALLTNQALGPDHPMTVNALVRLNAFHRFQLGYEDARAEGVLQTLLERSRRPSTNSYPRPELVLVDLAEFHHRHQHYPTAESLLSEALETLRGHGPGADPRRAENVTGTLGLILSDWAWAERSNRTASTEHRALRAVAVLEEVLDAANRASRSPPQRLAALQGRLGAARSVVALLDVSATPATRERALRDAEKLLVDAHSVLARGKAARGPRNHARETVDRLVRLYDAWDKPERSAHWIVERERLRKEALKEVADGPSEVSATTPPDSATEPALADLP